MTQILQTYQTPNLEKTPVSFITTSIYSNCHTITERLSTVIAKLERQDIGWLDILTAMANIAAEQEDDEQVAEVLEATALLLKRNRKIRRDL
ncbi:MAG TPA: hypothetical protein V6D26_09065 [Stenomitos sp.]